MNKRESRQGWHSVIASVIAILVGMLAGGLIILIVGLSTPSLGIKGAWEGFRLVVAGLFSTGRNASGGLTFGFNSTSFGNMLFRAAPLIMTGLSVALANKSGLFNIGAPGQYLAGTAASLYVALSVPTSSVPAWLVWLLAFIAGMAAGALWGSIPGLLKAYLNINEVIACIMTNWIAANLVTWLFESSSLRNVLEGTKQAYIYKTSTVINDVMLADGTMVQKATRDITEGMEVVQSRGGVATAKL
ncbi:MAG: ABC transporter permease, partial [Clostridia bacterium]|nr:ABC transporter permease [Clostridia bacterium]